MSWRGSSDRSWRERRRRWFPEIREEKGGSETKQIEGRRDSGVFVGGLVLGSNGGGVTPEWKQLRRRRGRRRKLQEEREGVNREQIREWGSGSERKELRVVMVARSDCGVRGFGLGSCRGRDGRQREREEEGSERSDGDWVAAVAPGKGIAPVGRGAVAMEDEQKREKEVAEREREEKESGSGAVVAIAASRKRKGGRWPAVDCSHGGRWREREEKEKEGRKKEERGSRVLFRRRRR